MTRTKPRHRRRRQPPWRLLLGAGVLLTGIGVYGVSGPTITATVASPPPVVQGELLEPGVAPVETPPKASCEGPVEAAQPRRLRIPSVGINACVQRVGLDDDGAIGAPVNVHVAGWFTGSANPGRPGLSILDGHNRGARTDGVFIDLHELRKGARIAVEQGDGSILEYVVRTVATHDRDVTMERLYDDAAAFPEALGIITCAGAWDRDAESRADRVVVIATPA